MPKHLKKFPTFACINSKLLFVILQDSILLLNLIFYNFSKMYSVHKFGPFPQVSSKAVTIISIAGFLPSTMISKLLHVLKSDYAVLYGHIHTLLFLWCPLWLLMVSSFNIHNFHVGARKIILKLLTYLSLLLNFTVNFRKFLSGIVSLLVFSILSNAMLKTHLIHILW